MGNSQTNIVFRQLAPWSTQMIKCEMRLDNTIKLRNMYSDAIWRISVLQKP